MFHVKHFCRAPDSLKIVMAGLDPATHAFFLT
jgi:hypothetical protein